MVHRVFMEAVVAGSNAAHADSITEPADMPNSGNAANMSGAAKTSDVAAAKSAAATRLGRACQQTRSQ